MLEYLGCGLKNIWLKNGYSVVQTAYGEAVSIHNLEGLHKTIGIFLVHNSPLLSAEEFRFLRKELNLSQISLANMLGVGESTVRAWENNRSKKTSIIAERMLRALYLDKVNGNETLNKLLERISQLDRDKHINEITLEETNSIWKEAA